jgi:hypothetical protein
MSWRYKPYHQPGNPLEEPAEMQAGNNQHHGSEQDDGREVDAANSFGRADYPECKHQCRSDYGGGGTIDLRPWKTPNREDQVTGEEYSVSEQKVDFRTHGEGSDHAANSRAVEAEGIEISRARRSLRLITARTRLRTNVAMRVTEFVMSEVGNAPGPGFHRLKSSGCSVCGSGKPHATT